ncbi:MAG: c-type cytochrome [Gemmatimonadota bacterium]
MPKPSAGGSAPCSRIRPGAVALALTASLSSLAAPAGAFQVSGDGRALFEAKCAACHSTGADRSVGPGLADVMTRRDRAWVASIIADPAPMIAGGDSIAARLFAEYQIPMPALGLSGDEVDAIVVYLEELRGSAEPGAESASAPEEPGTDAPPPVPIPAAGDPAEGRALFTGERRLENGGPACLSCHSAGGLGVGGGGTLARDLSQAAVTYGPALPTVLRTAPFPLMRAIFASRPLTDAEIDDLSALLADVAERGAASESALVFPLSGLGGTLLLLLLAGFLWRGRLNGVRKPLIGGHR